MINTCSLPQGQKLSWKPDSLKKTQQRNRCFFPGERGIVSAVPTTRRWGWDHSKEKPKRVPDRFPQGLFLPQALGILFLPLKVQFLSMRRQQWATRDDANLNGEVGTTLRDCCLTFRTSWLSPWRIVSYLIRGPTSGSLDGLGQGSPTSEALSGWSGLRPRRRLIQACWALAFCGKLE